MHGVVHHRGKALARALQKILANDDERDTRWAEVLLRARVDEAVLGHIYRPTEHVRGGVGDKRHVTNGRFVGPLGAEERVVRGEVHVGRAGRQRQLVLARNAPKVLALGRPSDVHRADALCLLHRLLGPPTGHDVVGGGTRGEQIHRHHRELGRRAALQKKHLVVGGDTAEGAHVSLGLGQNRLERLRAMADLQHRHAHAGQGNEVALRFDEDGRRKHGRPGREVEDLWHEHESLGLGLRDGPVL